MTPHPFLPLRAMLLVPLLLLAGRPNVARATCTDEDGAVFSAGDKLIITKCEDCDTIHEVERKCLSSGEWEHVDDETDGCPWEEGRPYCKPVTNTTAVCQEDPVESDSSESDSSESDSGESDSSDGNITGRGFSSLVSSAGHSRHSAGAAAGAVTAVVGVVATQLLAW